MDFPAIAAIASAVAAFGSWAAARETNRISVTLVRSQAWREIVLRVNDLLRKAAASGITDPDKNGFDVFMAGIHPLFPATVQTRLNDLSGAVTGGNISEISKAFSALSTEARGLLQVP